MAYGAMLLSAVYHIHAVLGDIIDWPRTEIRNGPAARRGFRYPHRTIMDERSVRTGEADVNQAEPTNAAEQRGEPKAGAAWPDAIYRVLREFGVTQFAYVPDAGHKVLIDRSLDDPEVQSVALTTEEEGVGLLAGAHLGGARGVLLMQSSGVGNCINFLSLVRGGQFPFLMLVSMRGDFGEGNPWRMPMGRAVEPVLEAMGVMASGSRRQARFRPPFATPPPWSTRPDSRLRSGRSGNAPTTDRQF